MKKRLSRKKGFTLVECIIAVAVFGLMSLVIFMILTNASVRAAKASESEENLAQLIENVVGDETYKKYDAATSGNLTLLISNDNNKDLTITYNVISGYKNFVECPNSTGGTPCGHHANFTEFMSDSATTMVPHNDPYDFVVGTNFFVCPSCDQPVTFTLRCPDCGATDVYNKTSSTSASGYLFTYINKGAYGFECSMCGSSAVMAVDAAGNFISEKVSVDGFNVSGMVPNGIRLGEAIDWDYWEDPSEHHRMDLCKFRAANAADPNLASTSYDTEGKIQAHLKYEGTTHSSNVGTYSLKLTTYGKPDEIATTDPSFIEVVLPAGYTVSFNSTKFPQVTNGTREINGINYPTLLFKRTTSASGNVVDVGMGFFEFQLTSVESGASFEYDYSRDFSDPNQTDKHQGLFRWFGFNTVSVPGDGRTADHLLLKAEANGLDIGKE